jgi:hypothetical protein
MSEVANSEQEQSSHEIDSVARMTRWEKCEFLFLPVSLAALAGFELLVLAFCLIKLSLTVLFNFQTVIHHLDRLKQLGPSLAIVIGSLLAISGVLLIHPALVLRKMVRRKKQSGRYCPNGEELLARKYRSDHLPLWLRVVVPLFFSLIAIAVTHSLWVSPEGRVRADWIWPALLWLVAIIVAVEAISSRPGRQWTGFVASSALGLEAILAVVAIFHQSRHTASGWGFPLLMALFSVIFAVATVQEGKKKVRNARASHAP